MSLTYFSSDLGSGVWLVGQSVSWTDLGRQKGVVDEYEIDPKRNEGVAYPYHDVKRGRAERKTMHGGDCECCTGVSPRSALISWVRR